MKMKVQLTTLPSFHMKWEDEIKDIEVEIIDTETDFRNLAKEGQWIVNRVRETNAVITIGDTIGTPERLIKE
jgi:hypothetical protein